MTGVQTCALPILELVETKAELEAKAAAAKKAAKKPAAKKPQRAQPLSLVASESSRALWGDCQG